MDSLRPLLAGALSGPLQPYLRRIEGYTVVRQRRQIGNWAQDKGATLLAEVVEEDDPGELGGPQLLDALRRIRSGDLAGVVVARIDVIHPDVGVRAAIAAHVRQASGRLAVVQPTGASDAGAEVAIRAALATMAIDAAMETPRASFKGRPPFGTKALDGRLVVVAAEQATLRRVDELSRAGLSLRVIGDRLLAEGHQPRRGETWHPSQIKRLLDRLRELNDIRTVGPVSGAEVVD